MGAGLGHPRNGALVGGSVGFCNALAVSVLLRTKPVHFQLGDRINNS